MTQPLSSDDTTEQVIINGMRYRILKRGRTCLVVEPVTHAYVELTVGDKIFMAPITKGAA